MVVQFFVPHRLFANIAQVLLKWDVIVWTFALMLSGISLFIFNVERVYQKSYDRGYRIVLLIGFLVTLLVGFIFGKGEGSPFMFIFQYFQVPLQSTMFSLLAFFIASAAYRAFRARTKEATLLLIAAFIVMMGSVPIGDLLWSGIPRFRDWILQNPNMFAQRGILIGAALGGLATALRILVGIERGYFGGGES